MASTLRPIRHEDRLSLVEHLDELRTRLIICVVAFVVALRRLPVAGRRDPRHHQPPARGDGVQATQDDAKRPARAARRLPGAAAQGRRSAIGARVRRARARGRRAARRARQLRAAGARSSAPPRAAVPPRGAAAPGDARGRRAVHRHAPVAAYAALLLSLPLLLFQAYAFVLPAFSREERQVALPLMADGAVPVHRRRRVRATSWCCRTPSTSCRTSTTTTTTSSLQAQGLLPLRDHGPDRDGHRCSRCRSGSSRITRVGIVSAAQLRHSPPLRDPRHRGRRDAAAGPGSGDDAVADAPALPALRGLYPVGSAARPARCAQEAARAANRSTTTSTPLTTMLFDLRGSGRRRTVKIVYITLAFLMGGGLVLFGIGGGGGISGGLVDAITERSGGGDTGADRFSKHGGGGARAHAGQPAGRRRPGPRSPARASSSPAPARTSTPRKATFTEPAAQAHAAPATRGSAISRSTPRSPTTASRA